MTKQGHSVKVWNLQNRVFMTPPQNMANFSTSMLLARATFETTDLFLSTASESKSDEINAIKWSTYAAIVYFSLYILLIIVLSIHIHKTEGCYSVREFGQTIWKRRGIYGQILVHLYDTATDIGVLIEWGILAYDDNDYYSIDMRTMFYTSIGFLIFYRFISVLLACYKGTEEDYDGMGDYFTDCCLAIVDMYIIKTIYQSLKDDAEEATPQQKVIQLLEAVFESLPQVYFALITLSRARINCAFH